MTSDALTDILCASSATVMVSGTWTSLTTASVGAWKLAFAVVAVRSPAATRPARAAPAGVGAGVAARLDLPGLRRASWRRPTRSTRQFADLIDFLSRRHRRSAAPCAPRLRGRPACAACLCGAPRQPAVATGLGLDTAAGGDRFTAAVGGRRLAFIMPVDRGDFVLGLASARSAHRPARFLGPAAAASAAAGGRLRRPGSAACWRSLGVPSACSLRSALGLLAARLFLASRSASSAASASRSLLRAWQALLLFAQVRFLALDQLRLAALPLLREARAARLRRSPAGRDRRRARSLLRRRRRRPSRLHEGALLADFDLDRARLAGGVGLLDLGGFLAGHRDLLLFGRRRRRGQAQAVSSFSLSSFDNGSDVPNSCRRRQTAAASAARLQAPSVRWQIGLRCYSPFSPLFYVSRT